MDRRGAEYGLDAPAHLLWIDSGLDADVPDRLLAVEALRLACAHAPRDRRDGLFLCQRGSMHSVASSRVPLVTGCQKDPFASRWRLVGPADIPVSVSRQLQLALARTLPLRDAVAARCFSRKGEARCRGLGLLKYMEGSNATIPVAIVEAALPFARSSKRRHAPAY